MLLKVRSETQIDASAPDERSGRRLSQWAFDPKSNTLTECAGVTSAGAKRLVVDNGKLGNGR